MFLAEIFSHKFEYDEFHLYDKNGNEVYFEDSFGYIKNNYKRK